MAVHKTQHERYVYWSPAIHMEDVEQCNTTMSNMKVMFIMSFILFGDNTHFVRSHSIVIVAITASL